MELFMKEKKMKSTKKFFTGIILAIISLCLCGCENPNQGTDSGTQANAALIQQNQNFYNTYLLGTWNNEKHYSYDDYGTIVFGQNSIVWTYNNNSYTTPITNWETIFSFDANNSNGAYIELYFGSNKHQFWIDVITESPKISILISTAIQNPYLPRVFFIFSKQSSGSGGGSGGNIDFTVSGGYSITNSAFTVSFSSGTVTVGSSTGTYSQNENELSITLSGQTAIFTITGNENSVTLTKKSNDTGTAAGIIALFGISNQDNISNGTMTLTKN